MSVLRQALRTPPIKPKPTIPIRTFKSSILNPIMSIPNQQSTETSTRSHPATPIEDSIRTKLTTQLSPTTLEIHNDSHLHAHHAAMQSPEYAAAKETHFRVRIVSDVFQGKMQPARHRMVYALLKEEMQKEGGVHALQLTTRTAEEEAKSAKKG